MEVVTLTLLFVSIPVASAVVGMCSEVTRMAVRGTYNSIKNKIKQRTEKNNKIKKMFSKSINAPTEICVICMENYTEHDKCVLLNCEHVFHKCCLNDWFNERVVCPLCNE